MIPIFVHFERLSGVGHVSADVAADRGVHVPGLNVPRHVCPHAAAVVTLPAPPQPTHLTPLHQTEYQQLKLI